MPSRFQKMLQDNACGLFRHLRKQLADRKSNFDASASWSRLSQLALLIDRLHWTYHKSCRDPSSPYYVPDVDPSRYPTLVGVDTEAAEQIFHIANRWQFVLSNSHPVHQEMWLLVFAREHNVSHSCRSAVEKYQVAQDSPINLPAAPPPRADVNLCVEPRQRRKKPKRVEGPASCVEASSSSTQVPSTVSADVIRYAVCNYNSKTLHSVILQKDAYAECGWCFQGRATVRERSSFKGQGLFTCGVCFGARLPH